jgi:ubiquitin carboxyl-terminal hydrolase 7
LEKYIEVVDLPEYNAENIGIRPAKKTTTFEELPRILMLQLKRFQMNPMTNVMEKINQRFEYYDQIDLNKYTNYSSYDNVYNLHAVIVHSGEIDSGHYYTYLKPEVKSKWYKFDDEVVSRADDQEVFQKNYGGDRIKYHLNNESKINAISELNNTSAYLLLYIKKSCIDQILTKVKIEDVINNSYRFQINYL